MTRKRDRERKLARERYQRQQARQAERARKRRKRAMIIGSACLVAAAAVGGYFLFSGGGKPAAASENLKGAGYPAGTVAMAHTSAPDSNGSQFFLVYKDSTLPPNYTAFGTIDQTGLATLDKIAAAGVDPASGQGGQGGQGDGKPKLGVQIKSIQLD